MELAKQVFEAQRRRPQTIHASDRRQVPVDKDIISQNFRFGFSYWRLYTRSRPLGSAGFMNFPVEHRGVAASAGTVRLEKERLRAVKKLLAQIAPVDLKLKDFEDIRLIRTYQQKRIAEGVGPRTVNMEGQLMRSILKHHDQWKLDGKYQPLPEPLSEAGRSLTPEEEVRLCPASTTFSGQRQLFFPIDDNYKLCDSLMLR